MRIAELEQSWEPKPDSEARKGSDRIKLGLRVRLNEGTNARQTCL